MSTTAAFTGITTDANSLTITPSSGSVNQTIYVRLSGASAGTANSSGVIILNGATITHTSSPATPKNLTVNGNIVVEPTVSSNIAATTVGFNSATISLSDFVPGTGIYALIVVRAAGTPAVAPTDQTAYTANTVYGNNGAASITGPGNYVVLSDIDVSVTVTGLSASTAYTADVYDYNADTPVDGVTFENYKPTPKSVNFTTTTTPLAYYNFTSGVAAAFTATNVMASSFQRGGGLTVNTAAASAGTFASSGYGTNFTANDYVGFSIEPASTYQLNLTSLTYTDIIGTVNGPSTIEVRASTTSDFSGTVVNLATYTTSTTSTERTISLTGTAFQGLKVPVYFRVYGYAAGTSSGVYRIDNVNVFGTVELAPVVAEINVKNPAGTDVATGGTYDFGTVQPGTTATATFTIQNLGTANLLLTGTPAVQVEAGGSTEFTVTAQPATTTIAGAGSTTFTVTYTPSALTAQTATLTIANNDSDENPYRIVLNGLVAQPYVWNGTGTNWNTASSWTPARTIVDAADVLVFDGTVTPTATVTPNFSSPQTVAQLIFRNGVTANFNNTGTRVLNITNGNSTDADFVIGAGSTLTVTGSSASTGFTFQLGTGATALVAGSLIFNQGPNRLQATSPASIEFVSGSSYLSGADESGSPFGSIAANANSVTFRNGSRAEQANGTQIFGLTAPATTIVLEPTSLYVYSNAVTGSTPPLSNRTFGNLEFNVGNGINTSSTSGGALTIAGNLTVTSGNVGLNLANTISVAGNISVNGTSTLTFSPSAVQTLSLNGTTTQTIGGTAAATALTFGPNATLQVNNAAGVVLAMPVALNRLTLTSGVLTTTATNLLTLNAPATLTGGSNTSYVAGPLARASAAGASALTFPVGKGGKFRPATLTIETQTNPTTYVAELFNSSARTTAVQAPLTRVSAIRYVNITPQGGQPDGFRGTVTLSFDTDDAVTDPSLASLVVAKRSLSTDPWINIDRSASTGTANSGAFVAGTLTSGAFTSFSDFALASTDPASVDNPLPVELTRFSAAWQADGVQVKWATASEKNNARFEVQRSADGKEFSTIATVQGQGQSTRAHAYAFLDRQPLTTVAYYRLRQVDFDGKASLSPKVTVEAATTVSVFPNPARTELHVLLPATAHYRVLSTVGSVVLEGNSANGGATLNVASLPAGMYQLEVTSAAGRVVRKFIKEN
ncbi:choice-of-anchor D domain-containing protein [Hymenobacter persicinus]|uniref:Choice-of-anchor D domain-containing protein n=1 Tax=Hymenobacter persicinus TaxID=2025506 RepID=A0A4Q5L7Y9_9BACT|nr:choice-of-anchor D domain-containing protein [Hymenobacter persicinus]